MPMDPRLTPLSTAGAAVASPPPHPRRSRRGRIRAPPRAVPAPRLAPPAPPHGRRSRRWRIVARLVAVLALGLAAAARAPPGSPGSGATGDMVQAVNQDRAANGLGPVAWDGQLYGLAQAHANEIAAS